MPNSHHYAPYLQEHHLRTLMNLLPPSFKVRETESNFYLLCPYHNDHNPSARVSKTTNHFKCYACKASGPVDKLIRDVTGNEISRILNIDGGMESLVFSSSLRRDENRDSRGFKKKEVDLAVAGQLESVNAKPEVVSYLTARHFTQETISAWGIRWGRYVKVGPRHLSDDKWSTFVNRILIPVYRDGRLVNMEARDYTGTQAAKVLYPKGCLAPLLYGIERCDRTKPLIVVEGTMDMPLIWQEFDRNVVAAMGSNWTPQLIEELQEFPFVTLFIDDDDAGHRSVDTFDDMYDREFGVTWIPGTDPGDRTMSLVELREAIGVALDSTLPGSEYFIQRYGVFSNEQTRASADALW